MDTSKEQIVHFLGTPYFWEWLISTLILIALMLLGLRNFQIQIQNGVPPSMRTLLVIFVITILLVSRQAVEHMNDTQHSSQVIYE